MPLDSARTWHLVHAEAYCQIMQQLRVPLQSFSAPLGALSGYGLTLLLFDMGPAMIVLFGALGTLNLGLIGLGFATAQERAQGWLRLKRASPMSPFAHFAGKVSVVLLNAVLFALALLLLAALFGHLPASISQLGIVFLLITLGVLPFCTLGLALAYAGGPHTAQSLIPQVLLVLITLAVLPAFEVLPAALQAPLLALNSLSPLYHFAVLISGAIGLPALQGGPAWLHLLALAGLTALFLTLAVLLYRRDEGKTYG